MDIDYDKLLALLDNVEDVNTSGTPILCSAAARAIRALRIAAAESHGPNEIMRAALQEIAAKAGMTLLGPEHDTERHHEIGAHKAFGDCALIAEVALKRFDATSHES